jgi:phasin family protein
MTKFVNDAAFKAGSDAFEKGYEQFVTMTREQIQKVFPAAVENFDALVAFNKGNVDAAMAASKAAAKGFETFADEVTAYNKAALEAGMANAKALMGCKTAQELVEVQTAQTRAGFEKLMSQGTKLGEIGSKITSEAFQPIQKRFNEAAETFAKQPTAAA